MQKTALFIVGLIATTLGAPRAAYSAATLGQAAPDFTLNDPQGKSHSLSAEKGKYVVLEWFNDGCPFVRKHYDSGNMQKLQAEYKAKGVTWFSILSSAKGKEGHASGADAQTVFQKNKSNATALLLDADGKVGHAYDAKTTPHMFIIDPAGKLIYKGGIDDKASVDQEDIATAKNYVKAALDEALAGKPVTKAETKPYGCSVKY